MSIFAETEGTQSNTNTGEQTSWLDKVVKDKGEKFRDPEELAKSVFNSQMHIRTIEEENKALREKEAKEEYSKQLLEALRGQQPTGGENRQPETNTSGGNETNTQLQPEDIKKLVEEAVTERERNATAAQNLSKVDEEMRKAFGDQAGNKIKEIMSNTGLGAKDLELIASKSPTAFLAMVGQPPKPETNRSTESSVNTTSFSFDSGRRNWKYYQDLRKSDPKRYRSAAVQNQMDNDYAELGSRFWE